MGCLCYPKNLKTDKMWERLWDQGIGGFQIELEDDTSERLSNVKDTVSINQMAFEDFIESLKKVKKMFLDKANPLCMVEESLAILLCVVM